MGKKPGRAVQKHRHTTKVLLEAQVTSDELIELAPEFGQLVFDEAQARAFDAFCAQATLPNELVPGFVIRLDRGFPLVVTASGSLRAEHATSFTKARRSASTLLPVVGDCVVVRRAPQHEMGVIEHVLPRRTAFVRWRGNNRGERQVLAANINTVLIVQALGSGRDEVRLVCERIARSLVLVHDCGAQPAIVLTKIDRVTAEDLKRFQSALRRLVGSKIPVVSCSCLTQEGLDEVRALVGPQTCSIILGESGAGKSTLLNTLLGHDALATGAVRERDDRGRHTTVARVMVALPQQGGVVVDAPGLRSLPLVGHEQGLSQTFPEISEAAVRCRFADCTHTHEPHCAVLQEVSRGAIDEVRLEAYRGLAQTMRLSAQSLDPDVRRF